jgi:hypothetical protein
MDALIKMTSNATSNIPWAPKGPNWRNPESMQSWPWYWSEHFRMLRDFAQDGQVWPEEYRLVADTDLPKRIAEAEDFLNQVPTSWLLEDELVAAYHAMWVALGKARARIRLDSGQDLSFYETVLLSGIAPKSVRNATQERHGAGRLIVGNDDIVSNEHALAWLRGRRTFSPTPGSKADVEDTPSPDLIEFVFVPVDEAGRAFDPEADVQTPPGPSYHYAVGDDVRYTNKYMDALLELQAAERAHWLRSDGEWSQARSWKRVVKADLRRSEKRANEKRSLMLVEWNDWVVQKMEEHEKEKGSPD